MKISQVVVGIVGIPLGVVIIYYRVQIKDFTGSFGWAEKYFGPGGTWTGIAVIGIAVLVCSFLWVLGVFQKVVYDFFSPIF